MRWLFSYEKTVPPTTQDSRRRIRVKDASLNGLALLAALDGQVYSARCEQLCECNRGGTFAVLRQSFWYQRHNAADLNIRT
mmetsp:Transcript_34193/g.76988  ORF Transcript_34193/g.76988 Transcript_34193/m.76988 type:complete len:81 (+) Transcript_34193:294-536(+)